MKDSTQELDLKNLPISKAYNIQDIISAIKNVNPQLPDPNPNTKFEKQVMTNDYAKLAWYLGNPHGGHPEGALCYHILRLQNLIRKYAPSELHEPLLKISLLHDIGKIGERSIHSDAIDYEKRMIPPNVSVDIQAQIRGVSNDFMKEYTHTKLTKDIAPYFPIHTLYSHQFAKHLGIKNKDILDVLKYHDTSYRFIKEEKKNNGVLNKKAFVKIFSKVSNLNLLLWFTIFDDASSGKTDKVIWLYTKLTELGLMHDDISFINDNLRI